MTAPEEIRITPEMIYAGIHAFWAHEDASAEYDMVEEVFEAMAQKGGFRVTCCSGYLKWDRDRRTKP